jgi:phage terminase large subunit-like protein
VKLEKDGWAIVYDKAIRADGSLFFPERLSREFLESQLKTQGSYIFTNQYQNEIIPEGLQVFRREWLAYYKSLPDYKTTFAFIDPAVGKKDRDTGEFKKSDFTALAIVDVDIEGTWFLKVARRAKLTVTQQVKLVFDVNRLFKPTILGIEDVAYQNALIQLVDEKMRADGVMVPIKPVTRSAVSKQTRIKGLVPRFEWRRILLAQGLHEFEREYLKFPRAAHDDIMDAVASINEIYYPPHKTKEPQRDPTPNDPGYEKWYIGQIQRKSR